MPSRVYFRAHGGVVQGESNKALGLGMAPADMWHKLLLETLFSQVIDRLSRYFARKKAIEYQITGWVRNTDDNKVEGEAQGDKSSITQFLKDIDNGPRSARVVRLDRMDIDPVGSEVDFEVRR